MKLFRFVIALSMSCLCMLNSAAGSRVAATQNGSPGSSPVDTAGRILFVLSSARFHGQSQLPASISFGEVVHAWDSFTAAGYDVDFVSPEGGAVPIDPSRLGASLTLRLQDQRIMKGLLNTAKPTQIDAGRYRVVYFVGGSNAMYGVPENQQLQAIARHVYEKSRGIVSAVCHGSAALAHLKLSSAEYLIKGKRVTGYPEDYEDHAEAYYQHLPFKMRATLESRGARFSAPHPERAYVEVDGRLVTGQNYASAKPVATAIINLLQADKAN